MRLRRSACTALACALVALTPTRALARPGPNPLGAVQTLAALPFRLVGDGVGGIGLVTAGTSAFAFDLVSELDDNRLTRRLLRGVFSRSGKRLSLAVSNAGTGALEGLRAEDIERLPEPVAAYATARAFAGRLDTVLDGFAAFGLAAREAFWTPWQALLQALGDEDRAAATEQRLVDARVRALGPSPLPED